MMYSYPMPKKNRLKKISLTSNDLPPESCIMQVEHPGGIIILWIQFCQLLFWLQLMTMMYELIYFSEIWMKRKKKGEFSSPFTHLRKTITQRVNYFTKCFLIPFTKLMAASNSLKFAFTNRKISKQADKKETNANAIADNIVFTSVNHHLRSDNWSYPVSHIITVFQTAISARQ